MSSEVIFEGDSYGPGLIPDSLRFETGRELLEPELLRKRKGLLKLAQDFGLFPDSHLRTKSNIWLGL